MRPSGKPGGIVSDDLSSGGEFRVGSDVPIGRNSECGAIWTGEWEDRAEPRP